MSDTPSDAPAETEEAAQPAGPPPDPEREALLEALRADLGDALLDAQIIPEDLVIRVDRTAWRRVAETLKIRHGFEYFCFLSGIDWLKSPELETRYEQVYGAIEGEEAASDGDPSPFLGDRVGGGDGRFTVFLRLQNLRTKLGITVKADLDDANPAVETLIAVFRGADWHERETWEMFGFDFTGHPALRHIYLPTEFEGFPLRKDFPLLARAVKPWPGLVDKEPIPGEDEEEEANA
ncbi:MAG TPA: NADH-quinone oxidoreductase subunit C [Actinomycetota bacterium]|jgi:NADH-quinone oxidoreductase subunit C|nr:NADH-quinone oxidoreductase subunit C [Actinomycetota bacterium]HVM08110.1 NADH-quinone oxidoreductase subunit C [Acidimicrobiales bacterium]